MKNLMLTKHVYFKQTANYRKKCANKIMWKTAKNIKKLHNMMKGNVEECVLKPTYQILEQDFILTKMIIF